jgi:hypothetical protein
MIKYIEDNPIIGKQWKIVNCGRAMLRNKKYIIEGYIITGKVGFKIPKTIKSIKYAVNDVLIINSRTDPHKCMIFVKGKGKK